MFVHDTKLFSNKIKQTLQTSLVIKQTYKVLLIQFYNKKQLYLNCIHLFKSKLYENKYNYTKLLQNCSNCFELSILRSLLKFV